MQATNIRSELLCTEKIIKFFLDFVKNNLIFPRSFNNSKPKPRTPKGVPTMPKKKALDTAKLIEMVKAETPSAEIMKKMGFKTSTQLKTAYMSALIAEGKVPAIKGGRGAGKAKKVKTVGVGKRGSIIIPQELVEGLGIDAGEKFTVRKTKAGIALKKAE
jgi:AbrB family looped-hinge helix DNA binding protein